MPHPRKVVHIDDGAIAALRHALCRRAARRRVAPRPHEQLAQSSAAGLPTRTVVGVGLNAEEMVDNPQLTRHVVHDFNREPWLPFGDEEFHGAMCAVSIQYLVHPC